MNSDFNKMIGIIVGILVGGVVLFKVVIFDHPTINIGASSGPGMDNGAASPLVPYCSSDGVYDERIGRCVQPSKIEAVKSLCAKTGQVAYEKSPGIWGCSQR